MARTPVGATARAERVSIRLEPSELATLDTLRGAATRSTYLRALIDDAAKKARRRRKPTGDTA